MTRCLVCNSPDCEPVLDLGPQPVAGHFTTAPNASVATHNLTLSVCHLCGIVQLQRPFPSYDLTPLQGPVTYREPEAHLDDVVEIIADLSSPTDSSMVLGLSSKDRTTIERIERQRPSKALTIDARSDLGASNPNAGIEVVQSLLTPARAQEIITRRGAADLVIARHIVEHAEDPRRLLAALGKLLAPGGHLIIEVPDCLGNLKRQDYAMIWEEHTLYLTEQTIPALLAVAGCTEVARRTYRYPFEDVIVVIGRRDKAPELQAPAPDQAAVAQIAGLARAFGGQFTTWTQKYRGLFEQWTGDGKLLAAFGAGHLTSAFINFHQLGDYFSFVADDTPQKQGLYMPGCALPIVPSTRLDAAQTSACLFGLGPQTEDKVIAANQRYRDNGGVFHSMLVDSTRSIRKHLPT